MSALKKIKYSYSAEQKHWVGDGFHVLMSSSVQLH